MLAVGTAWGCLGGG